MRNLFALSGCVVVLTGGCAGSSSSSSSSSPSTSSSSASSSSSSSGGSSTGAAASSSHAAGSSGGGASSAAVASSAAAGSSAAMGSSSAAGSAAAASSAASGAASSSGGVAPVPYAVGATVDGKTYGGWAAAWWQFMFAIPTASNPILDVSGTNCVSGQVGGGVFFLAGSGGNTPVTRSCTIPANSKLFFPVINYVADYPCPDPNYMPASNQTLEAFLTADAATYEDPVTNQTATVDGTAIPNVASYRAHSPLFMFTADASWQALDGCISGSEQPAVADGFWLLLPPLSAGTHTLHFSASVPNGGQDVTYNLTVQ